MAARARDYRPERGRSCSPHSLRSTPQISPIVQRARSALAHRQEQVLRADARRPGRGERRVGLGGVPLGADPCGALELAPLGGRVDLLQLDRLLGLGHVAC